jgi:catechol 2,3-dioxygenase
MSFPEAGGALWMLDTGMPVASDREIAMTTSVQPRLSHCGIYVNDIGTQVDFYTRVLGLIVSDRGVSPRIGNEFAFLTAGTDHHHQVVFISGRAPQGATTVNQLSFKVGGLDELKIMYARACDAGVSDIRQINHGNALSFYFNDPEGNGIEVYIDTPWYVPQPHGVPIDLTLPSDRILVDAERHCRETPGFMPLAEWRAKVESRLRQAH